MTSTAFKLVGTNPIALQHMSEICELLAENARLNKQVQVLSSEQGKLQEKINAMGQ